MTPTSAWREFWRELRRSKPAMIGLCVIATFVILGALAPVLAPFGPADVFSDAASLPPIWLEGGKAPYWLGTDDIGRDLLSRLLYGARVSLLVGVLVAVVALILGSVLGLIAGYWGGLVEGLVMRLTDVLMALPNVLLAIVVVSILGPNLFNAILAVAIVQSPAFIRLARAAVRQEMARDYVVAARTYGASHFYLLCVAILPNCLAPLIVQAALSLSGGILDVAALGFLNLGAQAPTPEWGVMLADARAYVTTSPWMVTLPGLCILAVVLGFNLLGDGVRDVLDPKLKR